jgi:hypothetical protein
MIFSRYLSSILLIFSLVFLIISCGESKTAQCQKIIAVTRKIAEQSAESRQTKEVEQVLKMADNFDESAKTMNNLTIADAQLAKYQKGYGEIYQANADITRKFIAALKQKDIVAARLLQKQVQDTGDREKTLRAEINSYCQAN